MHGSRSSGRTRFGIAMAVILLGLLGFSSAQADTGGSMDIDIHDGQPWVPIWDTDPSSATGNFMTGIDTWDYGFKVERIWFYHGGDYPDSGIPYQIHLVQRFRYGDDETFYQLAYRDRETTCNHCWEEVSLGYNVWGAGSDEVTTFGVFIRPFGGSAGGGYWPMLWRDQAADHDQLAALLNVYWPPPYLGASAGGRDDPYSLFYYNSDSGLGEVLLGMEVSSEVITSTEEASFSTIKSLY
jgi:hypothetical protein